MAVFIEPNSISVTSGNLTVTLGASASLNGASLAVDDGSAALDQILFTILTPPAHGTITLSGSPVTQFTMQDVFDVAVFYNNDGISATDSFECFVSITEVSGVATPYTPQMLEKDYGPIPDEPDSPDVGAIYIGMMLDGDGTPPIIVETSDSSGVLVEGGVTTATQPITVSNANSVVLVQSMTMNPVTGYGVIPPPDPCVLVSLTCPGLTFTKVSDGHIARSHNAGIAPDPLDPWTVTTNIEVWWAYAPTAFTDTLSVVWSATATAGFQMWWYIGITGAANPTSPFDTNPSNFSVSIGDSGNMPLIASPMQPDAPDQTVAVMYATAATNGLVAEAAGITPPEGYFSAASGGGGIGAPGSFVTYTAKRGPQGFHTINIIPQAPPPPPSIWTISSSTTTEISSGVGDVWLDSSYIDFSDPVVRANFITPDGAWENFGQYGDFPTGVSPLNWLTVQPGNGPDDILFGYGQDGGQSGWNLLDAGNDPITGDPYPDMAFDLCIPTPPSSDLSITELSVSTETLIIPDHDITLKWSDDAGASWSNGIIKSVGAHGEYLTAPTWYRLGMARSRIFEVSWAGAQAEAMTGIFVKYALAAS